MPQVAENEHVFVPFAACEIVTGLVNSVLVWFPFSAAVKLNVYLVPLMVRLPDLLALELMV